MESDDSLSEEETYDVIFEDKEEEEEETNVKLGEIPIESVNFISIGGPLCFVKIQPLWLVPAWVVIVS